MGRLTGEDFQWRSTAMTKIKDLHKQGNKVVELRHIEMAVGASTMHLCQVLDGVIEELIENGVITEVALGTVYFAQGG